MVGEPGALGADRVLGDLDQHRLTGLEDLLDLAGLALGAEGVPVDLAGIEHGVAAAADVDEGRLHRRQHVLDPAEVDVADQRGRRVAVDVVLHQDVVLEHGDLGEISSRCRITIARSTDSRRARNSASLRIGARRRPASRPSRRRCRLASSRVEPSMPAGSSLPCAGGRARGPGRPPRPDRPASCRCPRPGGADADAGGAARHRTRRTRRHQRRPPCLRRTPQGWCPGRRRSRQASPVESSHRWLVARRAARWSCPNVGCRRRPPRPRTRRDVGGAPHAAGDDGEVRPRRTRSQRFVLVVLVVVWVLGLIAGVLGLIAGVLGVTRRDPGLALDR